jgi:hypothetical protein
MLERPLLYVEGFLANQELILRSTKMLEKYYTIYAKRKGGIVSNHGLETHVFQKTLKDLGPLSEKESLVMESVFDHFLGAMHYLGGDGKAAIAQIEKLAKEGSF